MSKYQVIARKFRPQVFEDVVGQKPIVQTLQNAIQLDRIGHAYLFSGPRGVGKTTTARLLAKGLNCIQGPTITPCNQCPSCQEIASGKSIDVFEIDAASNTGVDNIRELRESAKYAAARNRYKIFIIDEVHMLSTSAFNALLKILEEPPPHVVFIMATTERHKLPATILSRCQQFVFRTISPAEIHAHLRQIADREGVKIDDRALGYIVRAAEGSMRDAQSLLDQIISFSGQQVVDEDVRDVLGFIPSEILDRTVDALAERDSKTLLENVGIVMDQGLNLQQYVREFIGRVRDLLVTKLGLMDKVLGNAEEKRQLTIRAERFSEQDLIRFFDILLRLESDLRWTAQPRFHLEVGFIKLAKVGHVRDIEDVIRDLKGGGTGPAVARTPAVPAPKVEEKPATPEAFTFADIFNRRVDDKSPTTGVHLLKATRIERTDEGIQVYLNNATTLALLESKEHKAVLDGVASELFGKPISVSLIMKEQQQPKGSASVESAKDEPLVKRFLEVFRGDLAQVKPAKGE
ncbi:MAG: DNA polymerase III subunit gamma/tau [Acidobacteria bacterium]|nr:DNA polymerase III subunit gamma/tau [Acidobacteriota bacterium]